MTLETGGHGELRHLAHHFRRFHMPVAVDTIDSAIDVNAVIEVCEVRNAVDSLPWQRNSFFVVLCQFDDFGLVLAGNGVTVHANRNGGNRGVRRRKHPRVAVLTVDSHRPGVELVRKSNWLYRRIPNAVAFGA